MVAGPVPLPPPGRLISPPEESFERSLSVDRVAADELSDSRRDGGGAIAAPRRTTVQTVAEI